MAQLGLACIIAGWLIQLFSKNDKIQKAFVAAYCVGVVLLVLDSIINSEQMTALMNFLSLGVSAMVLYKLFKKK